MAFGMHGACMGHADMHEEFHEWLLEWPTRHACMGHVWSMHAGFMHGCYIGLLDWHLIYGMRLMASGLIRLAYGIGPMACLINCSTTWGEGCQAAVRS